MSGDRLAQALLGRLVPLLAPDRREWAEAIRAELTALPPGRPRLRWLAGGLWAIRPGPVAACRTIAMTAAAIAVLVLNCFISTGYRGALAIQLSTALTIGTLAGLPLISRQRFGVQPGSSIARTVRLGGYLGIWLLLLTLGRINSFGSSPDNGDRAGQVTVALLLSGLLVGHGATLLVLTGRRAAIRPASLTLGSGAGLIGGLAIWAMLPTGAPWHSHEGLLRAGQPACWTLAVLLAVGLPLLAGMFSARHGQTEGHAAGLSAAVVGTLVLLVCTLVSMRMFPHLVPLEWANPDPSVPHGTPFEWRMSLQDHAASYLWLLLFGPLVGIGSGAIGTALADERGVIDELGLPG